MRGRGLASGALVALLAAGPGWAQADKSAAAPAEPILQQLEAFRRSDYDTAYTFASEDIKRMFDRPGFEWMVRGGYPEIARSTYALVVQTQQAPNGHVYITLKIRGANGQTVEALYEMVWEDEAWKINGVVTKPDPGLV